GRLHDEHEVLRLPSASALVHLRQRARKQGLCFDEHPDNEPLLAVLADPIYQWSDERLPPHVARENPYPGFYQRLPAATAEARALIEVLGPGRVKAWIGADASADVMRSGSLERFPWLHFAVHSFNDPGRPSGIGLLFSMLDKDGNEVPGGVPIDEIARIDLQAELVTLSVCQSAMGEQMPGEGVVGLAQAFFAAGASRVVASLWDVPDSEHTVRLMELFYDGLVRGLAPPDALRQAQVTVRSEGAPPDVWAAFIFIGPWDRLAVGG
ncbi:MAG: CHAT domain-containing protein, partial [Acidobacteriota bacterium]